VQKCIMVSSQVFDLTGMLLKAVWKGLWHFVCHLCLRLPLWT